jgi:hypothetical protein
VDAIVTPCYGLLCLRRHSDDFANDRFLGWVRIGIVRSLRLTALVADVTLQQQYMSSSLNKARWRLIASSREL